MAEILVAKEPPPALHVTDYSMGVNEGGAGIGMKMLDGG
jgi:hypothetical protein